MIDSNQVLINLYAKTLPKRNESNITKCWNICQLSLGFRQQENYYHAEDIRKDVWFITVPKQKATYFRLAYESRIIPPYILPMIINTQKAKDRLMEIVDWEVREIKRPMKRASRIERALLKNGILPIGAPLWFTADKRQYHIGESDISKSEDIHQALLVHNYFHKILQNELFKWI